MEDIKSKVKEFILTNIVKGQVEDINNDTSLLSTGLIDSITALELVEYLEDEFNIEFQAHEMDQGNLNTLDEIESFVKSKL